MKAFVSIAMFLTVWMGLAERVAAQVKPLGMPEGKYVNSLKVYNDTLFASCSDGLYMKDLRKDEAWTKVAFEGKYVSCMVKSGDDILAICMNMKYRETPSEPYTSIVRTNIHSGEAEVCTPHEVSTDAIISGLAQDITNPSRVFVSCLSANSEYDLYHCDFLLSDDFGNSWCVASGFEGAVTVCQHESGATFYLYGNNANLDCICPFLYTSTDCLNTIDYVGKFETNAEDRLMDIKNMSVCPHDDNRLLISGNFGVALSDDGGVTWTFVTDNSATAAVFFDETDGQKAYFVKTVTEGDQRNIQLHRSADGGHTWALWQEEKNVFPMSIILHEGNLLFFNYLNGEVYQWTLKKNEENDMSHLKEGKRWVFNRTNDWDVDYDYSYTIEGDTLIGDNAYRKVYEVNEFSYKDEQPHYRAALREDGLKVFMVDRDHPAEDEFLLYDFEQGETYVYDEIVHQCVAQDEISVKGREYRRMTIRELSEEDRQGSDMFLVEGIGLQYCDLLEPCGWTYPGSFVTSMLSCWEGDECIFTLSDFDGSSPTGISDRLYDASAELLQGVYDLQGRLVSRGYAGTGVSGYENQRSAPTGKANRNKVHDGNLAPSHPRTPAPSMKKGVYIVGGRKYVVK